MNLLSIYNDLMINKEKRIVMFGYNRHTNTLVDSILDVYTNNYIPGYIMNVTFTNVITITDPVSGDLIYAKGTRLTYDFYRQCCDNLCLLYVFLRHYHSCTEFEMFTILKNIEFNITIPNKEDKKVINYVDVLTKMTIEYIKNFEYSLEDRKIIAYLKAVLLKNYDLLDDLANSIYAFSYKYIVKDIPISGQYLGNTELQFTYFNSTNKVIYDKDYYSQPILIVNKYYQGVSHILYNIAIKTTIGMTDYEFEHTLNRDRLSIIKIENITNLQKFVDKYKINYVIKKQENQNIPIKIKDLKQNDFIYPIFQTKEVLRRGGDISLNAGSVHPYIKEKMMSVFLGRSKLYTMPFWRCNQYDNMSFLKEKNFDHIPLQEYLKNRRLERFLKEKNNPANDKFDIKELSDKEEYFYYLSQIQKHKIYDINWTTVLPVNSLSLKNLLTRESTVKKTYEKKIFKTRKKFM